MVAQVWVRGKRSWARRIVATRRWASVSDCQLGLPESFDTALGVPERQDAAAAIDRKAGIYPECLSPSRSAVRRLT